jgi:hypothetical protein
MGTLEQARATSVVEPPARAASDLGTGTELDLHLVHHGRRISAHTGCEIPTASS